MRSSSDISKQSGGIDCKEERFRRDHNCFGSGEVLVLGIGPGDEALIAPMAIEAMKKADVVAGYKTYLDLITPHLEGKEIIGTGMMQEVARCEAALAAAIEGKKVVVVSSGDAGVYGMAGIMHQIAAEYEQDFDIEVIPGITAACSGAAVLGAPLISDFAVISLSDLLTPWEKIAKRLECAAMADFSICLYNPSSIKRHDYLQRACDLILKHQNPTIPTGIVRNIGRDGETYEIVSLQDLRDKKVDMFTTVIIGNSQTEVINNKLVTPRGYKLS